MEKVCDYICRPLASSAKAQHECAHPLPKVPPYLCMPLIKKQVHSSFKE